ncbi:hypothetical protein HAX54_027875 [Datura stramonium]|uniref:Uncharacterized protein n=1 Tax=Datura stramonium TaxID=4076 RepID=A0ABS8S918_DATST|nr:hypothetical protein [Datura stramonium]
MRMSEVAIMDWRSSATSVWPSARLMGGLFSTSGWKSLSILELVAKLSGMVLKSVIFMKWMLLQVKGNL